MDLIRKNKKYIIIGLLPALLFYLILVIYPIGRSFYYGFFDWNGLGDPNFIGLKNFTEILTDPVFFLSLKNTMFIVVASVFGQLPIGLIIAVILSKKMKGARFFRSAFFMPMIMSTVVVALLWSTILNSQVGIINTLLNNFGLQKFAHDWLGDPKYAMFTVSGVIIWQFVGFYMIIFLAALQNIPEEIMEAASIDGAGEVKKLFLITLPMMWDTIMAAVVLCIAGSMRSFDLVFVMTQGGPAHATEIMATYMYNKTFSIYRYGYGSAVSLTICLISLTFIIASRVIMRKKIEA